jgi:hypothetical protein
MCFSDKITRLNFKADNQSVYKMVNGTEAMVNGHYQRYRFNYKLLNFAIKNTPVLTDEKCIALHRHRFLRDCIACHGNNFPS